MTDIDIGTDIELRHAHEHLIARIPLAGPVTDDWIGCYQRLARAANTPVRVQPDSERAWLAVTVPAGGNWAEVTQTMDSARNLITEANAALMQARATAEADTAVRAWWSQRGERPGRRSSMARVVRTGIGQTSWLSLASALAVAIVVLLLLPPRFSVGPNWIVPAIEGAILIAMFVAGRRRPERRSTTVRVLSMVLVLVLVVGAAFVATRLVVDLIQGGPETGSAAALLGAGAGVWIYTIITFAFLYWLLDGGGPEARVWDPPEFPHLAFPEQLNRAVAPPGWRPAFGDYLYLGFTNATAFSPTDVMPLARWAKLAMTIQAASSLVVLGLVIARAVNIFK